MDDKAFRTTMIIMIIGFAIAQMLVIYVAFRCPLS
jgi:hypothetical protein